jgi:hypothetical protein
MRLHKFKSGGRWALTKDRTGRNLPDSKPAWAYMSAVEMKADDGRELVRRLRISSLLSKKTDTP